MSFGGKVVLITGASSGIGADAARHFAKLGAQVVIVGRNASRLNAVADEILKAGGTAPVTIIADVNQESERIINETIERTGQLDVLVNNAGILSPVSEIENLDLADLDRTLNTNLRSLVALTKLSVPHLAKTKGNIVNISSIAALRPRAGLMAYCVSKAAVDQFTKCAALELASKSIRVNSINPGIIKTPIFQAIGIEADGADDYYERSSKAYPLGRVGEVSDTSAAIAFLASDSASFITGDILKVDGGKMLAFKE